MTPEEITAMAKEAGFPFNKYGASEAERDTKTMELFEGGGVSA